LEISFVSFCRNLFLSLTYNTEFHFVSSQEKLECFKAQMKMIHSSSAQLFLEENKSFHQNHNFQYKSTRMENFQPALPNVCIISSWHFYFARNASLHSESCWLPGARRHLCSQHLPDIMT